MSDEGTPLVAINVGRGRLMDVDMRGKQCIKRLSYSLAYLNEIGEEFPPWKVYCVLTQEAN